MLRAADMTDEVHVRRGLSDAEKAAQESANGLKQYDLGTNYIQFFLDPDRPFALRSALIKELQSVAVSGLDDRPGEYRMGPVKISHRAHVPPPAHLVSGLVEEMCDYVNDNWHTKVAFHLAAYVMWRLNWIHPFADGNGRTSRVASYIVLCTRLGSAPGGKHPIPLQIQQDRTPYFDALEAADTAWQKGGLDVSRMEQMLTDMLAFQLLKLLEQAGTKLH